jgi:hypothetical protein
MIRGYVEILTHRLKHREKAVDDGALCFRIQERHAVRFQAW